MEGSCIEREGRGGRGKGLLFLLMNSSDRSSNSGKRTPLVFVVNFGVCSFILREGGG